MSPAKDFWNRMFGQCAQEQTNFNHQKDAIRTMYEEQNRILNESNSLKRFQTTQPDKIAEKYAGDIIDAEFEVILPKGTYVKHKE